MNAQSAIAPSIELKGARVLVVDDIAENRKILTQTLESAGYNISAAPNGEIALKIVARNAPDVILLDLLMPGINGFQVCRELKKDPSTAQIPVIFITANNEIESVVEGFQAGAVDFISKPIQTEEVMARTETHLKLHLMAKAIQEQNRTLRELNAQLSSETSMRHQAQQSLTAMVEGDSPLFHTYGTLRHDSPSYVPREADEQLLAGINTGEFCYVLTSRQMGKSSLMARASSKLAESGVHVATIDLTALGQNLTVEQWYDGLLARIGRRLDLEDALDDFWLSQTRLNPVQRFFAAIRNVVLEQVTGKVALFIDELDVVRSLPFSTDEFFAAIRECYNRRAEDPVFKRLSFCLLGVATPSDLMADKRMTPFNIGVRVRLTDLSRNRAQPLVEALRQSGIESDLATTLINEIFHWTKGHPYLTQRLCRVVTEAARRSPETMSSPKDFIQDACERVFFSSRAIEQDDNLIFVRERLIRSEVDIETMFQTYLRILDGETILDDDQNPIMDQLHLSGLVQLEGNALSVRNRIYERVFNREWIQSQISGISIQQ